MKAIVFLLALFCGRAVAAEGSSIKIDVGAAMHLTKTKQMDPVGIIKLTYERPLSNGMGIDLYLRHQSSVPDIYDTYDDNTYGIGFWVKFEL